MFSWVSVSSTKYDISGVAVWTECGAFFPRRGKGEQDQKAEFVKKAGVMHRRSDEYLNAKTQIQKES